MLKLRRLKKLSRVDQLSCVEIHDKLSVSLKMSQLLAGFCLKVMESAYNIIV